MNIRHNKLAYEIFMDEFDAHRTKVSLMDTDAHRDTSFWALLMYQNKMLDMDRHELARYIIQQGWVKYYPQTMKLLEGYGHLYTINLCP